MVDEIRALAPRPWGGYACAAVCLLTVPPGALVALAMLLGVNFMRGWQDYLLTWSGITYPLLALVGGCGAASLFHHRKTKAAFVWLMLPVANLALFLLAIILVQSSGLPPSNF